MKKLICLLLLLAFPLVCFSQDAKSRIILNKLEATEAIDLSIKELLKASHYSGEFILIKAENLYSYKNPDLWLITFKSANLRPHGKGGEIFVTVDLKMRKCVVRYGE